MLASGTLVGRYRLWNLLGSGNTGDVFQAEEVQNGRSVVVKVWYFEPPLDKADESIRLFRREAAKIANLQHTHILPLLDYGDAVVEGRVLLYTVMYQHGGGTLDMWLRQRGPSASLLPADVVILLQPIADALGYAHNQQVVHQAVRPTNLLVRHRSDSVLPDLLLTDFGFPSLQPTISVPSSYVAPEQWAGSALAATDQYSLAAIAYRLLTGTPAFEGSAEQIKKLQMNVTPPLASERLPLLNRDIDTVLQIALAEKPQNRFASITAFANALRQASQQVVIPLSIPMAAATVPLNKQTIEAPQSPEQTATRETASMNGETDSSQQPLVSSQLLSLTTPSTALRQLSPPPTTHPLPAPTSSQPKRPWLRRDTPLMSLFSLLFLTTIIIAASSGISIKQQGDHPGIDATATAFIASENNNISSYGLGQGELLIYDPLNSNKAFWTSNDRLGTCDIVSFSQSLHVTTALTGISSTPVVTLTNTPEDQRFHACLGDYTPISGNTTSLPNYVVIEVQIQFDTDTSIGGILFNQVASDNSEKFFVFSIKPHNIKPNEGLYSFCLLNDSDGTCSDLSNGYFDDSFLTPPGAFNTIAVVIRGNVVNQLYLNENPLLSAIQENIPLEDQQSSQVLPISSIGVVAGVVARTENSVGNDRVELWYKNLKVWMA